jgi:hypothetical protein
MKACRGLVLGNLALALCASCPMLESRQETFEGTPTQSEDRIPVVDDVGPFDPSEAVDDDDGAVELADKDDPTDREAFSDTDGGASPASEGGENERAGDEPEERGESVATPAEVEALKEERSREVERADAGAGDEDEQKEALAENPPPEPVRESEGAWAGVLDLALETLLVAGLAAVLAAAVVFARSHIKTVSIAVVVIGILAWFVSRQMA